MINDFQVNEQTQQNSHNNFFCEKQQENIFTLKKQEDEVFF